MPPKTERRPSLAEAVAARQSASQVRPCAIEYALEKLDADDGAALITLIANPMVQLASIIAALAERGVTLSHTTLSRHRQRACGNCKAHGR